VVERHVANVAVVGSTPITRFSLHDVGAHLVTRSDLRNCVKQNPFVPFRLVLTEGTSYEVRHPEQIMVARDSAVIGLPGDQDDFIETTVLVDLFHVVRLEPIPTATTTSSAGNGQSG
jgi:hypothetical protein